VRARQTGWTANPTAIQTTSWAAEWLQSFITALFQSAGRRVWYPESQMRKVVEVFVNDALRAAYPVVLEELDRPSDDEFIEWIRKQMRRGPYSAAEIKAAKFVVRD
jgi:hypothetical protein